MWWPFAKKRVPEAPRHPLYLYNTLSKSEEVFMLQEPGKTVRMYNCGPTVYGRQHIGNLSMFVFADVLRRTLEFNGYPVKQVINITDVGHLTSDADEGEDKMTKGLKREGLKASLENMRLLADKYTSIFKQDISQLNIDTTAIVFPRASEYIDAQIAMIRTLDEKGYAYVTDDGVYYDTSRFPRYGELGSIDLEGLKEGARVSAAEKRNPTDFALWKFDKKLGWESPWGKGFPGWHIECSAMIRKTLGERIDIHTGGIEHIPVHHNNEIAQSEAVTGKRPLSRFWLHRAHIQIDGGKIAKSKGAAIYLSDVTDKGFHPLALRYLFLGAHYRTSMNFTWEALDAAQKAYARLLKIRLAIPEDIAPGRPDPLWREVFVERINADIDTSGALATLWEYLKDKTRDQAEVLGSILEADRVLGLNLSQPDALARELVQRIAPLALSEDEVPAEVRELVERRETARYDRKWEEADSLRAEIEALGFGIDDTGEGTRVFRKTS